MWSLLLCLALVAPSTFGKSVTLEELKRALTDYMEERQGELNIPGLFSGETRGELAPIGGGPADAEGDLDMGGLFGPQGGKSGPMANIDMRSMFQAEKRDSMGQLERLSIAVKEAQAAIDAGTLEVRMPNKAKKRSGHSYTMCVFCDDMCLAQIAGAGLDTNTYFDTITTDMNGFLQDVDAGSLITLEYKLIPGAPVYMNWFADSSLTGEELLVAINKGFWEDSGLYDMATSYGCDIDFLVASSDDPAWSNLGSVAGVANMMQLCQKSFSVVKMSSNPDNTAALIMHEFGHMLGMYHDGQLDEGYTSLESYFGPGQVLGGCAENYNTLAAACVPGISGNLMSATVGSGSFSDCSVAYFDMFMCLAEVMPAWYSTACV